MTLSEAVRAVSDLLDGFPNGGANAGDRYIGKLAQALCSFPQDVAVACCHPITGISRETRFLPTVADIVAFCEPATDDLERVVDTEDRAAKLAREARERAEEERTLLADRARRPSYDELKTNHGPGWGLTQADPVHPRRIKAARELLERANKLGLARICQAAGVEPGAELSPSPALLAVLKSERTQDAG